MKFWAVQSSMHMQKKTQCHRINNFSYHKSKISAFQYSISTSLSTGSSGMIQVIEIDTVNSTILRMKINFAFCNPILIVNKNLTLEKTLDFLCFFVCTVQNWNCCMNMVVGWIVIVIQYVTYYMPFKDMKGQTLSNDLRKVVKWQDITHIVMLMRTRISDSSALQTRTRIRSQTKSKLRTHCPPKSANSGSTKFFFSNEACQRVCCSFTSMQFIFWDGLDWMILIGFN